jgi:coproporphyrinogen III oxidase
MNTDVLSVEQLDMNNLKNYVLYANGVSLVIHPVNPFVPTVHANFRFMRVKERETGNLIDEWFGGGCDLTPNYLFEEDAITFHSNIKLGMIEADQSIGADLYKRYKDECDKYFHIKHRKEVIQLTSLG